MRLSPGPQVVVVQNSNNHSQSPILYHPVQGPVLYKHWQGGQILGKVTKMERVWAQALVYVYISMFYMDLSILIVTDTAKII